MSRHQSPPEVVLETGVHMQVTCFGCGRETEVTTSNAVGMMFKCMKCGSSGFYRTVIKG